MNKSKYRTVEKLPDNAMTVREFGQFKGWKSGNYIYEVIRNKKNTDFEIVLWKGMNWVIPKK